MKSPRIDSEGPDEPGRRITRPSLERRSYATPGPFLAHPAPTARTHQPPTDRFNPPDYGRSCLFAHDIWDILGPGRGPSGTRPRSSTPRKPARRPSITDVPDILRAPDHPRRGPKSTLRGRCATTDEPDILTAGPPAAPTTPDDLSITMNRTYLAEPPACSGQSTRAINETYEAFVHHDRWRILGACTHDEPDILLPMYRTYLGRALTMNRTYHYR